MQTLTLNKQESYNEAMSILNTFNKQQVREVKSLQNPPRAVHDLLTVVCGLITGKDKMSWAECQKTFSNPEAFCRQLLAFDYQNMSAKQQQMVIDFAKTESCSPEVIAKKSSACVGFARYLQALAMYYQQ